MNRLPPKFLIIFLAVIQLVAPLVHAHIGDDDSPEGIHLPGLESYEAHGIKVLRSAGKSGWVDRSFIVGIGIGVKQQSNKVKNGDPLTGLPYSWQQSAVSSEWSHDFVPIEFDLFFQVILSSASSRGPPRSSLH